MFDAKPMARAMPPVFLYGLFGFGAGSAAWGEAPGEPADALVDIGRYADIEARPGQDPKLTLVVAISGGGYRAANFALGALLAMERIEYRRVVRGGAGGGQFASNLLNEVDYFSTVSGGGLAAALAVMARLRASGYATDAVGGGGCSAEGRWLLAEWVGSPGVAASLRANQTARLISSRLRPDIAFTSKTSGDSLQMRLDRDILRREEPGGACGPKEAGVSYALGDVLQEKGGVPTAPYWFMNSTDLATGQIVPVTPGWLERRKVRRYWHEECRPRGGCNPFRVPMALALRSSMNFTVGIPPTRLVTNAGDHIYLTDGGESDNLGSVTAVEILAQEGARRPGNRRMLIVIDAFRGLGRKDYNTPRMPGLVNSLMRATSLPLDAHRTRVRRDLYQATTGQPSVLNAISEAGDVWVAYIDMQREEDALKVGTGLQLSASEQEDLICAGKRQTVMALGALASWPGVRSTPSLGEDGALSCSPEPVEGSCAPGAKDRVGNCRHIVAFNRQSKELLIGHLVERFKRTLRRLRQRVAAFPTWLTNEMERKYRAERRAAVLTALNEGRGQLTAPAIELSDKDFEAFEKRLVDYRAVVDDLRESIARREADKDDQTPGRDDHEGSWWDRIIDWVVGLLEALSGDDGQEDDSEADRAWSEMLMALDEMSETAARIQAILGSRAVRSGNLGGLRSEVFALSGVHDKVVILIIELETGDSPDLRDRIAALAELMGSPERVCCGKGRNDTLRILSSLFSPSVLPVHEDVPPPEG